MEIGLAVGFDVDIPDGERLALAEAAESAGYASLWTNASDLTAFDRCQAWHEATGSPTGISVLPTPGMDLAAIASRAKALGEASGDRFILGIGSGRVESAAWRAARGLGDARPLETMRTHVTTFKREARVPVYLAAMGPEMLRLVGEIADGALPNWMDAAQIRWARERIAEGARRSGRDPGQVRIAQYVRVSVDQDPQVARRAMAKSALGYTLAKPEMPHGGHYRVLMTRMGLDPELLVLEAMRERGASMDDLADACPDPFLRRLGAWGRPDEAVAMAATLAAGLDLAIVRVVLARPTLASGLEIVRACAPARWGPAPTVTARATA